MRLQTLAKAREIVLGACLWIAAAPLGIGGELFQFRDDLNGLTGNASGVATHGAFQMSLSAGPAGALFDESEGAGLGVDTRSFAGAYDTIQGAQRGEASKVNIVGGSSSAAALGESLTFSFNRRGVIRDLLFDGVKDESLEYFRLTLPGGAVLTFFDAEVALRLTQQGFSLADLTEPNVTLLVNGNDDRLNINIPFQTGDSFTLAYSEFPFPAGYVPRQNEAPNGARWEGLVVVPEPSAWALCLAGFAAYRRLRRVGGWHALRSSAGRGGPGATASTPIGVPLGVPPNTLQGNGWRSSHPARRIARSARA